MFVSKKAMDDVNFMLYFMPGIITNCGSLKIEKFLNNTPYKTRPTSLTKAEEHHLQVETMKHTTLFSLLGPEAK